MREPEGGLRRRFGFTGGMRICCLLAWDVADQQSVACSRPGWAVPHDPWVPSVYPWRGRVSGVVSTMRALIQGKGAGHRRAGLEKEGKSKA